MLWEFVDHRQEAFVVDPSVTHATGVHQLLAEHSRRRFIRLGGQVDDATFGPSDKTASRFTEHVFRVWHSAELMDLIDQYKTGFLAGHRVRVGRYDF
ncbi:hypothetical protein D3C87_1726770 [compost metagenome]